MSQIRLSQSKGSVNPDRIQANSKHWTQRVVMGWVTYLKGESGKIHTGTRLAATTEPLEHEDTLSIKLVHQR